MYVLRDYVNIYICMYSYMYACVYVLLFRRFDSSFRALSEEACRILAMTSFDSGGASVLGLYR